MKYILITGVAGFIGSKITLKLSQEKNIKIFGIDDLSNGKYSNIPKNIEFIQGDLSNYRILDKLPKGCAQILHLAGQSSGEKSFENPILDLKKNVHSSLNLINFGIENKVKKFIYASSMSVYGNQKFHKVKENDHCQPLSCYGVGKMAVENYMYIYKNKLPFVSMRMFNVYGPGQNLDDLKQGMVSIFLAQAIKNNKIVIKGGLNRIRDFIYIDDVVNLWIKVLGNHKINNQFFNIGSGTKTTVEQLIKHIIFFYPSCDVDLVEGTLGDQNFIYSNNKKIINFTNYKKFTKLNLGIKKFIKSINV